jgi:hypothetical protein
MQNIMAEYERECFFLLKSTRPCLNLLRTFTPYYFRHVIYRPYRQSFPHINYKHPQVSIRERFTDSTMDTIYTLMLDGYTELVKLDVRNGTGLLLKFLIEDLMRPLDELLEDELTRCNAVDIDELLESPKLKNPCDTLRDYTGIYGTSEAVINHLEDLFSSLFEDYWNVLTKADNTREFEDVLDTSKFQAGILLSSIMEVVHLFNRHDFSRDVQQDLQHNFYSLGMVVQFADDMVDLIGDIKRERINLLYALVCQNQTELQNLHTAIKSGDRLSIWWWRKYCPVSFVRYYYHINEYYNQITSHNLRITGNLLLFRAGIGRAYNEARQANGGRGNDVLLAEKP